MVKMAGENLEDDSDCADEIEQISDLLSELGTTILEGSKDMDVTDEFAAIEEGIDRIRKYLADKEYISND